MLYRPLLAEQQYRQSKLQEPATGTCSRRNRPQEPVLGETHPRKVPEVEFRIISEHVSSTCTPSPVAGWRTPLAALILAGGTLQEPEGDLFQNYF